MVCLATTNLTVLPTFANQLLESCGFRPRTVLHKMERYSEALHHFEAAEEIFAARLYSGYTWYEYGAIFWEHKV